jgi:hypothetical protein
MRKVGEILDEVIDDHIAARTRHHAFAAALAELFERYPASDKLREEFRPVALRAAQAGAYQGSGAIPVGLLAVPTDELFAVHALIYG